MKANRELDELLVAYILKELSAEEEDIVIRHISSDEKNRLHFEELKNTYRLLGIKEEVDEIDVNNEWKSFKQSIISEDQHLKIIKPKQETDPETGADIKENGKWQIRKMLIPAAVAASVIVIVFVGWFLKNGNKQKADQFSGPAVKAEQIIPLLRREVNKSGKPRKLVLHDGSEIVLADKSEVSFYDPFIYDRRDIILKGKADFKVAKDKTKPFTVYSLDLATTALGTEFTVTAFEGALNTIIRLNEGKVVITHSESADSSGSRYYLDPGEELIFNNWNHTGLVQNFKIKNPAAKETEDITAYADSPELPVKRRGSWYMFNNQELSQVFDQLSMLYSRKISYSDKDVENLYFIGSFNRLDSLQSILTKITSLNNLKLVVKDNQFTISK